MNHSDFIQLERTFRILPPDEELREESDINGFENFESRRLLGINNDLTWDDLIREHRIVILSEAGSGKTSETRQMAKILQERNKAAFFLRLEYLAENFETASNPNRYSDFQAWLQTDDEGWFFLDSVDEARLKSPQDFERAIRVFYTEIKSAIDRIHVVITGRSTAWRPRNDLELCNEMLPPPPSSENQEDTPQGFKILSLNDLTRSQVDVFMVKRGIDNKEALLEAVDRAYAWSFTARPQDLAELIEYWKTHREIGTHLDIVRHSIKKRLEERDQNHDDSCPLSAEKAREGAIRLAVATTLMKNQSIRIPDGADNRSGIDVKEILYEWPQDEQSALLTRPIFDQELYSVVRFHHRSVREYLAAEWFNEILNRGTSRRDIETLLIHKQYGVDVIVPTLRPVLSWLVILNQQICDKVLSINPRVVFDSGAPSCLPRETRCRVLHAVCERMAKNAFHEIFYGIDTIFHDRYTVKRFVGDDLSDTVVSLIDQYQNNTKVTVFLLHIVSEGKLQCGLPRAMEAARAPHSDHDLRSIALRVVIDIGTDEEKQQVRHDFLQESDQLDRDWLAKLIEDLPSTKHNIDWLSECLKKAKPPANDVNYDTLLDSVSRYFQAVIIDMIPYLLEKLDELFRASPINEVRTIKISKHHYWLLKPASEAIARLFSHHHPSALKSQTLEILHKFNVLEDHMDRTPPKQPDFSKLIQEWPQLNRAVFWFNVRKLREYWKNNGRRIISFKDIRLLLHHKLYWKFCKDDFDYVSNEIKNQELIDDRLVALSLAFDLYEKSGRPRDWEARLREQVDGNEELTSQLHHYLNAPVPPSDHQIQLLAEVQARQEEQERQEENQRQKKKAYLHKNIDRFNEIIGTNPEQVLDELRYFFNELNTQVYDSKRWGNSKWKSLIPEYGDDIARFYRNGAIALWRNYSPKLRSEGANFDHVTCETKIGLMGLEIESQEIENWPASLNEEEKMLACRYASFELSGFPPWFKRLYESDTGMVSGFLIQEVDYELATAHEDKNPFYMIHKLHVDAEWCWDQFAPMLLQRMHNEPKSLASLDDVLDILHDSNISDSEITKTAAKKCNELQDNNHKARWLAVWMRVAPCEAIEYLQEYITTINGQESQTEFAMKFIIALFGIGRGGTKCRNQGIYNSLEICKKLYLLMYEYAFREDRVDRTNKRTVSSESRDYAKHAMAKPVIDSLLDTLKAVPSKQSYQALLYIAKNHPVLQLRQWVESLAREKAERDSDIEPLSESQVVDFYKNQQRTPKNHRELADFAVSRLMDLKHNLEQGDSSSAPLLMHANENEIRTFIGERLRENADGRYSVPQEEEFADGRRPDIRFYGQGFDAPVPVELKIADKWSGNQLFERLENQLCGDYLRDSRSKRGIFLLIRRGNQGNKDHWEVPNSQNQVDFKSLISSLQEHWQAISPKFLNIDQITVIGIDLTVRSNR